MHLGAREIVALTAIRYKEHCSFTLRIGQLIRRQAEWNYNPFYLLSPFACRAAAKMEKETHSHYQTQKVQIHVFSNHYMWDKYLMIFAKAPAFRLGDSRNNYTTPSLHHIGLQNSWVDDTLRFLSLVTTCSQQLFDQIRRCAFLATVTSFQSQAVSCQMTVYTKILTPSGGSRKFTPVDTP